MIAESDWAPTVDIKDCDQFETDPLEEGILPALKAQNFCIDALVSVEALDPTLFNISEVANYIESCGISTNEYTEKWLQKRGKDLNTITTSDKLLSMQSKVNGIESTSVSNYLDSVALLHYENSISNEVDITEKSNVCEIDPSTQQLHDTCQQPVSSTLTTSTNCLDTKKFNQ